MPWLKRGINRFIPSVIWVFSARGPVTLTDMLKDGIILNLGVGEGCSLPRAAVDFISLPKTDIVADIHHLPFADNSVDGVFCTGTLEHVENPSQVMKQIFRVPKPRGIVHLEVPFMQPYHRDPEDYWRWTLDGLRLFARQHGFTEVRSGMHLGSTSAMNALIIAYWQSWFRNRVTSAKELICCCRGCCGRSSTWTSSCCTGM